MKECGVSDLSWTTH